MRTLLSILFLVWVAAPAAAQTGSSDFDAAVSRLVSFLGAEELRDDARKELAALGREAVPELVRHARHEQMLVRWEVASLLGAIGDERAREALVINSVRDESAHVRWRSLWALSRLDATEKTVESLTAHLSSDSAAESWNSAVALSMFGSPAGIELLHKGVSSPDAWKRWEAINALGRVHDHRTVETLAPALQSPSSKDRGETALTLGRIGGPDAVRLLLSALNDSSADVRWRAAMALGKTGDPSALDELRNLAESDVNPLVAEHAAKSAARLAR